MPATGIPVTVHETEIPAGDALQLPFDPPIVRYTVGGAIDTNWMKSSSQWLLCHCKHLKSGR